MSGKPSHNIFIKNIYLDTQFKVELIGNGINGKDKR
jgi:hypothetical protein